MKRIFFLLTVILLCFLTACGNGSKNVSAEGTETGMTATPTETQKIPETTAPSDTEGDSLDPYVAMLMSDSYYASPYESPEYAYNVYTSSRDDSGYVIMKAYLGNSSIVTVPDTMDGYPVIGMYHSIFEKCDFISEVTFPETLRTVIFNSRADISTCMTNTQWYQSQPDGVYYAANVAIGYKGDMPANSTITFREGTLGIGSRAFRKQKNLVGITIPESLLMISDDAFAGSGLAEVTIPCSLQYYFGAFGSCNALKRVTFQEGIEEIRGTVSGSAVEEVILPSTLVTIGEKAFMRCESLLSITLPDSVRVIKDSAFYDSGLVHIELNDGLLFIGKNAFMGCRDLKSIYIPASVTDLGIKPMGFIYDDTPVKGFVAYFEENCNAMEFLQGIGVTCEIGTRASANGG